MNAPVVLLVDDESEARLGVRYYLESKGYQILEATDGMEAIGILEDLPVRPEVIVLDLRMPRQGGLVFLHELKRVVNPPRVVVLTALSGDAIRQAAENYGVACVLQKPVALPVLEEEIRKVLERP